MNNLSFEEVKDFFKETSEFTVTKIGERLKISYTEDDKTTSTLIWNKDINSQELIRSITQLVWNHCHNILD